MFHIKPQQQSQATRSSKGQTVAQLLLIVALVIGLLHGNAEATQAAAPNAEDAVQHYSDTFLVEFTPMSTLAEREQLLQEMGVEVVRWLAPIHVAEVRLVAAGQVAGIARTTQETTAVLGALLRQTTGNARMQQSVMGIEANAVVTGADLPNDPDLLKVDRSYGLSVTHTFEGWAYTTGSPDVVIAVLDTGLNLGHPEFAGRIIPGYDFVNDDGEPLDDNGHGTHATGIIGAAMNNGMGSVGVCPECRIMPVKVLNQNNAGTWSGVANGIIYAADHGARVINLSLGAAVSSQTLENAVDYAKAKGVLIVAAAGNMGVDRKFYPAALENVMAVSATDAQDRHWSLSNYGDYIDVAAPGYAIYSTYNDMNNYYQGYTFMSGTSMASPFAAGLAGLLFSQHPTRTADEVKSLIVSTADRVGNSDEVNYFGQGRINVARALAVAADSQWTQVVDGEEKDGISPEATTTPGNNRLYLPFVTR